MTAGDWVVEVERIVLRDPSVTKERVERILDAVREQLRAAAPPPTRGAPEAPSRSIHRISVRTDDDDESIARVLAEAVIDSLGVERGDRRG